MKISFSVLPGRCRSKRLNIVHAFDCLWMFSSLFFFGLLTYSHKYITVDELVDLVSKAVKD